MDVLELIRCCDFRVIAGHRPPENLVERPQRVPCVLDRQVHSQAREAVIDHSLRCLRLQRVLTAHNGSEADLYTILEELCVLSSRNCSPCSERVRVT